MTVADPEGVAGAATSIMFGASLETLSPMSLAGRSFPVTFGVSSARDERRPLWIEGRNAEGAVLGRWRGEVVLRRGAPTTVTAPLARPCSADVDCQGTSSCRGRAACQDLMCVYLEKQEQCTLPGGADGWCEGGECVASVCGDARIDPRSETCDDANQNPADGCEACVATTWDATALVRGRARPDTVALAAPTDVAVDRDGDVYVSDYSGHVVRKVNLATGVAVVVAGTGTAADGGDGGQATAAMLSFPRGIAVDGLGNVFVADTGNARIRKVTASTGTISTVAGTGEPGVSEDRIEATSARLSEPFDVAIDGLGNLYIADFIADSGNFRISKVSATSGLIETVAGGCSSCPVVEGGPARDASLGRVWSIALDAAGALFISDAGSYRIRRVDPASGTITTVAGNGCPTPGDPGACPLGDEGLATDATLNDPTGLTFDHLGNMYFADLDYQRVRKVSAGTGIVTTVAGTGQFGFSGDGGPASLARLTAPCGLATDAAGNLYIADRDNNRIRRVDAATLVITSPVGTSVSGSTLDGTSATSVELSTPNQAVVDATGHLYVSDNHRVSKVTPDTGLAFTVAGTGEQGFSGDGGEATLARLDSPTGLAVDGSGNLYIADLGNGRVRRVEAATGIIATVAGGGGTLGDGGPGTNAQLDQPAGLAIAPNGDLYIADWADNRIRKLARETGIISTVAGNGVGGVSPDGGLATSSSLAFPYAVAIHTDGSLYIADSQSHRVRRVAPDTGIITTVAGSGVFGYAGDGGIATQAGFTTLFGMTLDDANNLYVSDTNARRVRRVDAATSVVTTIVGSDASYLPSGDGGGGADATLQTPYGLAVNARRDVFIVDVSAHLVRVLRAATDRITTVLGRVDPPGMGPLDRAQLADPLALVPAPALDAWLVAGGSSGTVQAIRSTQQRVDAVIGRYQMEDSFADLARYRGKSFGSVGGVAYDAARQRIYLSESSANRVHVVDATAGDEATSWTIAPLAGDAAGGDPGAVDGPAASARFRGPTGLLLHEDVLYIADTGNHAVRRLDLDAGVVSTVAGTLATLGFYGDDGPASEALFYGPRALARCPNGDVFIADTGNNRVRRLAPDGRLSTVLGDGTAASSGQGLPAFTFPVNAPKGLACDDFGNLFVSSVSALRMLAADDTHAVDGTGPVQSIFGVSVPRTPLEELSACLTAVVVVDGSTVRLTDACAGTLLELHRGAR